MPKQGIQPSYNEIKFVCTTCKSVYKSGSTLNDEVHVDTCSNCHPFYTGKQQFEVSGGKIEHFRKRVAKKAEIADTTAKVSKSDKAKNTKSADTKKSKTETVVKNLADLAKVSSK